MADDDTHENLDTRERDHSGLDVLLLELGNSLETQCDLGTGRNNGDVGVLGVLYNVTTLGCLLDR